MALDNIFKNLDITQVKTSSGLTYQQELVNAANFLSSCIQKRIRQKSLQNSISTADIADIKVKKDRLTVTLKIQNSIRPSIFKQWNKSDANVFWLINDGFKVRKTYCFAWSKNPERWTVRQAEQFVEDGIKEFNQKNKLGVKVEVVRPLFYYGKK